MYVCMYVCMYGGRVWARASSLPVRRATSWEDVAGEGEGPLFTNTGFVARHIPCYWWGMSGIFYGKVPLDPVPAAKNYRVFINTHDAHCLCAILCIYEKCM